ncbi:MAG: REP-associated tyrosine transposase [Alcanivoracaceae bacterium]
MTNELSPGCRALPKGRDPAPGQIYLITTMTCQRQRVFENFAAARAVINCMHDADRLGKTETLAFVVMPDHLHWLLRLTGECSLSMTVGALKGVSSYRVATLRPFGKLWQRGFHDHAVRRDEDLRNLARYLVFNPVRAGLVSSLRFYPHWDAVWL